MRCTKIKAISQEDFLQNYRKKDRDILSRHNLRGVLVGQSVLFWRERGQVDFDFDLDESFPFVLSSEGSLLQNIPKVKLLFRVVYCTVPNSYYEFFKVIYGWEFLFLWILLSFLGKSKPCFKVILCRSKPLPSHSYTTDNQLKLAQMESFFNDVSFWKSTDNFSEWTHVLLNFESFWITCKVSTKISCFISWEKINWKKY